MCGITGEISFNQKPFNPDWVKNAIRLMTHRGPDGQGFFHDENVSLGHVRLSIIDLISGNQPLSYLDKRYWIIFNGEIYNYRELRSILSSFGYTFATQSDTEVILAAYAHWGIDCLRQLNGIFAFAIWDTLEKTLLLCRDPLGVKPLLYHVNEDGLQFASELKSLLSHPSVCRGIDPKGLQDYLALGYVLAPRTIIKDIQKLEPGCFLLAHSNGTISQGMFWDLASTIGENSAIPTKQAIEKFSEHLDKTIKMQMVSDVPLGAFLSGGIDSSSIVSHAASKTTQPIKTFSIGFDEPSYSELNFASLAADYMRTDHYQLTVKSQPLEELARLIWLYDEPLGDTSLIPTYFVSRLAREHVTVVLSGDGGDELLAGYDTYLADRFQSIYHHIPGWMHRRVINPVVNAFIPPSEKKVSVNFMIRQFIAQAHGSPERAHYGWRQMFTDEERSALVQTTNGGYDPFDTYKLHYERVKGADPLTQSLYVDMKTWMVDDILVKVDRASMACSLESRVPFLAPDLVAFVTGLPSRLKLHGMQRKYLLKQAMKGKLPDQILYRKKRGFNAPISAWLRGPLGDEVDEWLKSRPSDLIDLSHPLISRLWSEHRSGINDHGFKLWTLLSLLLWEEQVLKKQQ